MMSPCVKTSTYVQFTVLGKSFAAFVFIIKRVTLYGTESDMHIYFVVVVLVGVNFSHIRQVCLTAHVTNILGRWALISHHLHLTSLGNIGQYITPVVSGIFV